MRHLATVALLGTTALAGCVDADLTTTILGPEQATVTGYMQIERQVLDMMGGSANFCTAEDGGNLVMTEAFARCEISQEGSLEEIFKEAEGQPTPTATDLGDGTVRVVYPLGDMTADLEAMRGDPSMMSLMLPMLEGHTITMRVAGAEIVSSTGEIAADGLSASFTFPLADALNPDIALPESFETIVRY